MNKAIPIFFTVNDKYVPFLSVAIESLCDHTSSNNKYVINVIHDNMSEENKTKLLSLTKPNVKICFFDMKETLKDLYSKIRGKMKKNHYFNSLTIYYRIFLSEMFTMYDKGIYLDSDIVVNDDVAKLFAIDLNDNLIGGVKDNSISTIEVFKEYIENSDGVEYSEYINSGVLLLNMKKLREIKFAEHFLYLLMKYNFNVVAPDQDYINVMCYKNIEFIPTRWDAMPSEGVEKLENPGIIHYNLMIKPWHYDDVDYNEYFWKYAKKSLFSEEIKKIKESFDEEAKKNDQESLEMLLKMAKDYQNDEVTFKKIFSEAKESRL